MIRFKNFFSKNSKDEAPREIKSSPGRQLVIPIPRDSWLEYIFSGGHTITGRQAMDLYAACSAVATAVDMIAEAVQGITPILKTKDGKIITDHPILDLLDQPNGFQSYSDYIGDVARHYLLKHDSPIIALGNVKRLPLQLYAVKPYNFMAQEDSRDSFPGSYSIYSGIGQGKYTRSESGNNLVRFYDGNLRELYHIMGFCSRPANVEGDSPLCAAALEARQLIKGRIHNLKLLENGGRLSVLVTLKGEGMDPELHAETKQRLIDDMTGENTGGIALISADDVDVKEFGNSNKDMDFSQLDDIAARAVYFRYRIPLPLISNDAATYNNFESGLEALFDWAVIPTLNTIFQGHSKFIIPRAGLSTKDIWLDYDPETISALKNRQLKELKLRKDINVETINELRAGIPGRDKVEGGDVVYISSNQVPAGTDILMSKAKVGV